MKTLITYLAIPLIAMSCTNNKDQFDMAMAAISTTNSIHNNITAVHDEPYAIKLEVGKTADNKYYLVAHIKMDKEAYFVHSQCVREYKGKFNISLEENNYLAMNDDFVSIPKAKEEIDPWTQASVIFARNDITLKREFSLKSPNNFEVSGTIKFVLEPRSTIEEIGFTLAYHSGRMTIKTKMDDGC